MPEEIAVAERRGASRFRTKGHVKLWWPAQGAEPIWGKLVDTSRTGFRASHNCLGLGAGQTVGFELSGSQGLARVVWTRVLGDRVESGFALLTGD